MSPAPLVLHGHFESGNVYKVALMFALSGERFTYRHVDLFNGATRTPDFLRLNRYGEVPVLEDGALVLSQSGAILTHLAAKFGRFGGRDEKERLRVLEWLLWDNHRLTANVGTMRFYRRFAKPEPGMVDVFKTRGLVALTRLETHLGESRFLVDEPTIADISCCAYVFWLDQAGLDLAAYPNIQAWLGRIVLLPGFKPAAELLPTA
ncbi:MAG: glutathione S-transferase family protein [Alphaproteobacteria bacterium]|nr:glutathione S-transferase family protein [Alphaproteobacteria bacterium]